MAWEGWETSRVLSRALHLLCDRSCKVQLQRGAGRGQCGEARMLKPGWGRPAQEAPGPLLCWVTSDVGTGSRSPLKAGLARLAGAVPRR